MAKPILAIAHEEITEDERKRQAVDRLMSAFAEHEEGLEAWLELVDQLERRGLLETVTAMLKRGDKVLGILVQQADKPGGLQLMKNMIALLQGMSSVDATALAGLFRQLNAGLAGMNADDRPNVTGAWSMLGLLRDPDVSAGLGVLFGFLKGFGQAVNQGDGTEVGAGSGSGLAER